MPTHLARPFIAATRKPRTPQPSPNPFRPNDHPGTTGDPSQLDILQEEKAGGPGARLPARPRTNAGPSAHLPALPQLPAEIPATPEQVDQYLADMEHARQAQLAALPPDPDTLVGSAHRRTVIRILAQLRSARARLRAGTYGICSRCTGPIPADVLKTVPWQTTCLACAGRLDTR